MVIICVAGPISSGRSTIASYIHALDPSSQLRHIDPVLDDSTVKQLYNYYLDNIVLYPVDDPALFHRLNKRSTVLLVYVSCPLKQRLANYNTKHSPSLSLESFADLSDSTSFHPERLSSQLAALSHVHITNSHDLPSLKTKVESLSSSLLRPFRPEWPQYFMKIANIVKKRSNCMKRRVGCVIVHDKRIVSTGYNGTPQGLPNCYQGGCDRCNSNKAQGIELDRCFCLHAEYSALLDAGHNLKPGFTCYTTLYPCMFCSSKLIGAGASKIIYEEDYNQNATADLLREAGVELEKIEMQTYHF